MTTHKLGVQYCWQMCLTLGLLVLLLADHAVAASSGVPDEEEIASAMKTLSLQFVVDPQAGVVTLIGAETSVDVHTLAVTEILDQNFLSASYTYNWKPDNRLEIMATFQNITSFYDLWQLRFLVETTPGIAVAVRPFVDPQFVLMPSGVIRDLRFEVIHQNQPFDFFVDVEGLVEGVNESEISAYISALGVPTAPPKPSKVEGAPTPVPDNYQTGEKCTEKTIKWTENFADFAAFNPNFQALWPGAVVQNQWC